MPCDEPSIWRKEGAVRTYSRQAYTGQGLSDRLPEDLKDQVSQRRRIGNELQPRGNSMFKGPEARERKPCTRN